jgi:hypothetical protein
MGSYSTADEVKQEYIDKLGNELGSLFHELRNEVSWLYIKWKEYVALFGSAPSRIDLLNQSAPVFFRIVQDTLWENMLLHIARLTDPPQTLGKDNLSIQRLPNLVDAIIKETISNQIQDVKDKTKFCRDWRNRYLAHSDFKLAIGEKTKPLEFASRATAKEALESIAKVLNTVSEHHLKSTIVFDLTLREPGGAEDLLYVLDDGVRANNERQERIKAGKYLPEDLKQRVL